MPHFDIPPPPRPSGMFFTDGLTGWHNATLDTSWYKYAEGYLQAADILVKHVQYSPVGIDFLIYPIVFLYRQYLELTLKIMVYNSAELLDKSDDLPPMNRHEIQPLWKACRRNTETAFPNRNRADLDIVESCINQFAAVDPLSFTFRYPIRKDGSPALHEPPRINVLHLAEEMANASSAIESLSAYLQCKLDEKQEFKGEICP